MTGRVLVLGGGVAEILQAPLRLGLEVAFVQRPEAMTPALEKLSHAWHVAPFEDHREMVRLAERLHGQAPFDCVVSFTELGLIPAALIGERLALPGASRVTTTELLRDKSRMREHLNRTGFSPVLSKVCHTPEEARRFAGEVGYPVVLKPRESSGSLGVRRAASPGEVDGAFGAAARQSAGVLVEEFLDGPEVSVEAFSFAGRHVIVAVTGKQVTANYVESGHVVPAMSGEEDTAQVRELVTAFLDLVGVTDGPSHTEVIVTRKGPRIVESHDRLGGDKIFRLVQLAYGVDLVSWCYEWPLHLMAAPAEPPRRTGAACIRYLLPTPGRVTAIRGAESPADDEAVDEYELTVSVGDEVLPLTCSLDRVGHVITKGAEPRSALAAAERVTSAIQVETTPIDGLAVADGD